MFPATPPPLHLEQRLSKHFNTSRGTLSSFDVTIMILHIFCITSLCPFHAFIIFLSYRNNRTGQGKLESTKKGKKNWFTQNPIMEAAIEVYMSSFSGECLCLAEVRVNVKGCDSFFLSHGAVSGFPLKLYVHHKAF